MQNITAKINLDVTGFVNALKELANSSKNTAKNINDSLNVKASASGIGNIKSDIAGISDSALKSAKSLTEIKPASASVSTGLHNIKSSADSLADSTQKAGFSFSSFKTNLLSFTAGNLISNAIQNIGTAVVNTAKSMIQGNAEIETYETQLTTLLGTSDLAKERIKELAKFGAETPFELTELVKAEKVLLGFGFNTEKTMHLAKMQFSDFRTLVGDISAGTGANFEEISLLFGKFGSGATGEAIARLQELGIATKEQMKQLGIEFDSAGSLISPLPKAFEVVTKIASEKFAGGMESLSQTATGLVSTLQDNIAETLRTTGKPLFDVYKKLLQQLIALFQNNAVQSAIKGITASIGLVFNAIATGIEILTRFYPITLTLAGIIGALAIAMNSLAIATGIYNAVTTIASGISKAFAVVQMLVNIVLNANPIFLLVSGIALLIAGLITAYKESETFRNIVDKAFAVIKAGIIILYTVIKTYFVTGFEIIKSIATNMFTAVKKLFSGDFAGAYESVKKVGTDIADVVQTNIKKAQNDINTAIAETKDKQDSVNSATKEHESAIEKAKQQQQQLTAEIKQSLNAVSDVVKLFNDGFSSSVNQIKNFKVIKNLSDEQYKYMYEKADEKQKIELKKVRYASDEQLKILEQSAKKELQLAKKINDVNKKTDDEYTLEKKTKEKKSSSATADAISDYKKEKLKETLDKEKELEQIASNNRITAYEKLIKEINNLDNLAESEKLQKTISIQQKIDNEKLQNELKNTNAKYQELEQKEIESYNKIKKKTAEISSLHEKRIQEIRLLNQTETDSIINKSLDELEQKEIESSKKIKELQKTENIKMLDDRLNSFDAYTDKEIKLKQELELQKLELEYDSVLQKQSLTDAELKQRYEYEKKVLDVKTKTTDLLLQLETDTAKKELLISINNLDKEKATALQYAKDNADAKLQIESDYLVKVYELQLEFLKKQNPAIESAYKTADAIKQKYSEKDKDNSKESIKAEKEKTDNELKQLEIKLKKQEITYNEYAKEKERLDAELKQKETDAEKEKTDTIKALNESLIESFKNLKDTASSSIDELIKVYSASMVKIEIGTAGTKDKVTLDFQNIGNALADISAEASKLALASFSMLVSQGVPVFKAMKQAIIGTFLDIATSLVMSNLPVIFTFLSGLIPPPFGQILAGTLIATGLTMLQIAKSKISGAETGYLPNYKPAKQGKGRTDNKLIWYNDKESIIPADTTKQEYNIIKSWLNGKSTKQIFETEYLPEYLKKHNIKYSNIDETLTIAKTRNKAVEIPASASSTAVIQHIAMQNLANNTNRKIQIDNKSSVEIEMKPLKASGNDLIALLKKISKKQLKRF